MGISGEVWFKQHKSHGVLTPGKGGILRICCSPIPAPCCCWDPSKGKCPGWGSGCPSPVLVALTGLCLSPKVARCHLLPAGAWVCSSWAALTPPSPKALQLLRQSVGNVPSWKSGIKVNFSPLFGMIFSPTVQCWRCFLAIYLDNS